LLAKNELRTEMPDEQNPGQQPPAGQAAGDTSAATGNTGNMIPKDRFDEVLKRAKDAEKRASDLESQLTTAEQQRLAETGNFQQLAENAQKTVKTLEPFKTRAEQLEAIIRTGNEQRINQIPEAKRALVSPLQNTLPPEALQAYLDANWAFFQAPVAPDLNAGAGGGSGKTVQVTDADRAAAAAANAAGHINVTAEQIAARRLKQ
jgi:hypothetical protein